MFVLCAAFLTNSADIFNNSGFGIVSEPALWEAEQSSFVEDPVAVRQGTYAFCCERVMHFVEGHRELTYGCHFLYSIIRTS